MPTIKITYGTNPGCVTVYLTGWREPFIFHDYQQALQFTIEMSEAVKKAWPGKDHING